MVEFAVDEFTVPSGGGTVSLSAPFQPNAAIFWWTGAFDESLNGNPPGQNVITQYENARAGFGYGVAADNNGSTEQFSVGWGTGKFNEPSLTGVSSSSGRCIIGANKSEIMWRATVTGWLTNGLSLTTFTNSGYAYSRVMVLMLQADRAGVDFTSFGAGATNVYSLNGGFPPDLAFLPYRMAGSGNGWGSESSAGLGVADRLSNTQGTVVGGGENLASGSAGDDGYSYATDFRLAAGIPGGAISQTAEVSSWDSQGLNVNVNNAPYKGEIGALLLEGVRGKIQPVTYDQHTNLNGTVSYAGVGYAPEAAMALTQLAGDGLVPVRVRNSVGASVGTLPGQQLATGQHAQQTTNYSPAWPMMWTDTLMPAVSNSVHAAAINVESFDPDGATLKTVRSGSTTSIGSSFDIQMVSLASTAFQANVSVPVLINPGTEVTSDRSTTVQVPTTFSFDTSISTAGGDISVGLIADFDVVTQHLAFEWRTPDGEAIFRVPPRDNLHIVE